MEFTRASQVATGVLFLSTVMTSRSWWMLETLRSYTFRLRMPHITFTLSFISEALVVLEVCLGSLCWNTSLRPSLQREGIMLCFGMSQYMLAFMVPSMNCSSPVHCTHAALMQLQTMRLPPPYLTVSKTHLSLYSSPGSCHTCLTPSEPNKFISISSDHRT